MKKIYLVLFGAMFMTTAFAQYGKGGLVLDSTYHTSTYNKLGETRETKTIYEYNADKKIAVVYYYDYFDVNHNWVEIPLLNQKQEAFYNNLGQITQIKIYFYRDGEYDLGSIKELSDYDEATGIPKLIIIKRYEQKEKKTVVKKINNYGVEDETEYRNSFDADKETWVVVRDTHYDYNSDGTIAKKTTDYGGGYITVITYEYDENKNVTKESSVTTYEGSVTVDGTYVDVYTNEYYDDGNLKKVTKTTVGEEDEPDVDFYFWGDGKAKGGDLTAINAVRKQMEKIQRIYDLNGRNVKNPTKGLYIVNGRKVVVK